jgi:hypothetical protein
MRTMATGQLSGSDWSMLREQVATIQAVVKKKYGVTFDQSIADLGALQRLIDDGVYDDTHPDELRAMGAVLGNVVVKQLGFEWVLVDDEPSLKLKAANTLIVKPLKVIGERLRIAARVDIVQMFNGIKSDAKNTRIV